MINSKLFKSLETAGFKSVGGDFEIENSLRVSNLTGRIRADSGLFSVDSTVFVTDARNVGTGYGWYKDLNGTVLEFKSLIEGSNKISVVVNPNDLTIDVVEANLTLSNIGGTLPFSKIQDIATGVLLGRSSALSGNIETINVGSGLALTGGTLSATGLGGTVTSVSVVSANGVSGSVANPTTTPAITLTIEPGAISNAQLVNSSLTVTAGTGLSGGGVVSLGGTITLTNAGVTSITGTTNQVIASASVGGITLSLPQSIGTGSSPTFAGVTATTFTGALSGNATTATLASTVTTNANLTGPITSVGNATSIASQTGTGNTFVMSAGPSITGTLTAAIGAFSGAVTMTVNTASTSTATGSLVVTGGVGISGALWVSTIRGVGTLRISDTAGTTTYMDVSGGNGRTAWLTTNDASTGLYLSPNSFQTTGTSQQGFLCDFQAQSGATTTARAALFRINLVAASFTATNIMGLQIADAILGVGSSAGTQYGLKIENQTQATTKYSIYCGTGLTLFNDTTDSTSVTTGSISTLGGIGVGKRLTLDGASGKTLRITNSVANASVATTLGSVGPTGSTAGNPQGWMRVDINGTDRYIPFW